MQDDLSLLFRLRGDSSGAVKATTDTRMAVTQLRSRFGTELGQMQSVGRAALSQLSGGFQGLTAATMTLDGPLGGIASRFSSIASLGGAVTSSAGAIGVALGAAAVAAVGAAAGIYKLVTSVAEATGKLHDLSQQTGFSVETLSALQNLAETSGGSIESITNALFIFETKMGEAKEKGSEMAKMFKILNIDTSNNERALRQAFAALNLMTDAETKATIGKKLFGRSVKELLGALAEAGGNFDVFIEKLKRDGLLVTTEMARRGDQLSDSVTRMGQRFAAIGRQVATEFEPLVTAGLKSVSQWLEKNGEGIKNTAAEVAKLIKKAVEFREVLGWLTAKPWIVTIQIYEKVIRSVVGDVSEGNAGNVDAAAAHKRVADQLRATGRLPRAASGPGFGDVTSGITGSKGAPDPFAGLFDKGSKGKSGAEKLSEGQKLLNQLTEEYNKLLDKKLERTKFEIVQEELKEKQYAKLAPQLRQLIEEVATYITMEQQAAEAAKKNTDAQKVYDDWIKAQDKDIAELTGTTSNYITRLQELAKALEKTEGKAKGLSVEGLKMKAWLAETPDMLAESDRMFEKLTEELGKQTIAWKDINDEARPYLETLREIEEKNRKFTEKTDATIGKPPPAMVLAPDLSGLSQFEKLQLTINEHFGKGTNAAIAYGAALQSAGEIASTFGQALGGVIHNFVLFGNAGTSFRKFAAEVIASVAAMAATKAIFEVAEGLAALARMFFGDPKAGAEAALHFKSAAMYGAIAAIAAVSGRAIAGNAFQQSASGGTSNAGSGGGGGSNSSSGSTQIPTTDINRRMGAPSGPPATLTINLGLKEGVVAEHFRRDYLLNGPTRLVIQTDGQS